MVLSVGIIGLPNVGVEVLPAIAKANPRELFVNPGAESVELIDRARAIGLDPILACSIVEIGVTPSEFTE